uniref:Reverse transcriptase Ty1/copia-type domain-containing protein n=1 Tax=Triticum urartu TaxID=4572 RepID=A0A8R7RGG2_TRIUA
MNDMLRTLLIQASMPIAYWVEALRTATFLLDLRPYKSNPSSTPYISLHNSPPPYDTLRVFGCLYYLNLTATTPHKLAPRSTPCVFLGYPDEHRGYCCLDLSSGRIIISCHVTFDEQSFPFATLHATSTLPHPNSSSPSSRPLFAITDNPAPTQATTTHEPPTPPAPPSPPPPPYTASTTPPHTPPLPAKAIPVPIPQNPHKMTTRAKRGFGIPARRLNLLASTSTISPVPKTYRSALHDPHWLEAMRSEFDAFKQNDTWELVPRPPSCNVVSGKWLFRHKFHADGSLARYKARWVCGGFSQQPGINYDETFSPVVKPSTIRAILSIATSSLWPIHQLDVKNAFLHGTLTETVYCQQPQGFEDPSFPDHV